MGIFPPGFDSGKAEITNFDSEIIVVEEDIVTFEVSMNDMFCM